MLKYLSTIATTLVLGLGAIEAYAMSRVPGSAGSVQGSEVANSVPELSAAAGPIAVAVILGIVGIGLERRRRKNKK
ncbi:MAG TPA: hypothetical protein DDW45_01970 [Gammaproteobacteria bacterium]|nr:hypothetical protein [Gammaproteobacteria bacterium]